MGDMSSCSLIDPYAMALSSLTFELYFVTTKQIAEEDAENQFYAISRVDGK